MTDDNNNKVNEAIKKRDIEAAIKRSLFPQNYQLKKHPIAIDVVDRTYGVVCGCGSTEFSEDEKFEKLFCSTCGQTLAIRTTEIGWITTEF